MKKLIITIVLIVALIGSYMLGKFFQILEHKNKIEESVMKEFALSQKYKDIPPCKEVISMQNKYVASEIDGGYIVWRYKSESQTLQKVVIDKDFIVAVADFKVSQTGSNNCTITNN